MCAKIASSLTIEIEYLYILYSSSFCRCCFVFFFFFLLLLNSLNWHGKKSTGNKTKKSPMSEYMVYIGRLSVMHTLWLYKYDAAAVAAKAYYYYYCCCFQPMIQCAMSSHCFFLRFFVVFSCVLDVRVKSIEIE